MSTEPNKDKALAGLLCRVQALDLDARFYLDQCLCAAGKAKSSSWESRHFNDFARYMERRGLVAQR
jgi:hypothetical protein